MKMGMKRTISSDTPEVLCRVLDGLDLVDGVAASMQSNVAADLAREELVSFGREGLLDAARRYDAGRGAPFGAWAAIRVRGAMLDGIRMRGALTRHGRRREALVGDAPAMDSVSPEDRLATAQLHHAVRASVARLPTRERRMHERMYFDEESMPLVSQELGISISWASRLHARAVAALWRDLRRRKLVA